MFSASECPSQDQEQDDHQSVQPRLALGAVEEGPGVQATTHCLVPSLGPTQGGPRHALLQRTPSEREPTTPLDAKVCDGGTKNHTGATWRIYDLRSSRRLGRLRMHGVWGLDGGWYPALASPRRALQDTKELPADLRLKRSQVVRLLADAHGLTDHPVREGVAEGEWRRLDGGGALNTLCT